MPLPSPLPEHLRRRITAVWPAEGPPWLEALPALLDECVERWRLSNLSTPFRLSYNYVLAAESRLFGPVVLKLGVPREEMTTEALSLDHYKDAGAVPVFDSDPDRGLLLMERLDPGEPLVELALEDDERATAIATEVFRRWRMPPPPDPTFPTLADWGVAFAEFRTKFGGSGPIESSLFELSESLFSEIAASPEPPVLLHGDLHHDNIISSSRGLPWRVIDPKGVIGIAEYEVGPFLGNPDPHSAKDPARLQRRIAQFADALGWDRARLRECGIAYHILSAVWSLADGSGDAAGALGTAEALVSLQI